MAVRVAEKRGQLFELSRLPSSSLHDALCHEPSFASGMRPKSDSYC